MKCLLATHSSLNKSLFEMDYSSPHIKNERFSLLFKCCLAATIYAETPEAGNNQVQRAQQSVCMV